MQASVVFNDAFYGYQKRYHEGEDWSIYKTLDKILTLPWTNHELLFIIFVPVLVYPIVNNT